MGKIRGFTRCIIEAKINVEISNNTPRTIEGRVWEISLGGCGIIFKENIDKDTVVRFELISSFLNRHLVGSGKIIYSRQQKTFGGNEFRVGMEFIEADKEIVLALISEKQRIERQERKKVVEREKQAGQGGSGDFGPF